MSSPRRLYEISRQSRAGSLLLQVQAALSSHQSLSEARLSSRLAGTGRPRLEGWGGGPLEIDTANLTIGRHSLGMLRDVRGQDTCPVAEPPSDGVLRVVTEARDGRTVVLDFNVAKPTDDKDALRWQFLGSRGLQSELLYRINSSPLSGTLSVYFGNALARSRVFPSRSPPLCLAPFMASNVLMRFRECSLNLAELRRAQSRRGEALG